MREESYGQTVLDGYEPTWAPGWALLVLHDEVHPGARRQVHAREARSVAQPEEVGRPSFAVITGWGGASYRSALPDTSDKE